MAARREAQQVVHLVGDDQHLLDRCSGHELLAAPGRHRDSGRVLERRDRVHERDAPARLADCGDLGEERLHDEPITVDRHSPNLQAVIAKHLEGEEVGRLLDDHDVAGFRQHGAQHLERLRVAVCGEQPFGIDGYSVRLREEVREREPVVPVAPFGAVLQEFRRVAELHLRGAAHVVDGKNRVVRLADTEVDHALGDHHLLKLNRRHRSNVGP